jgi:hypothetical protein
MTRVRTDLFSRQQRLELLLKAYKIIHGTLVLSMKGSEVV